MEALKAELARKKKEKEELLKRSGKGDDVRFVRRGDLQRLEEEDRRRKQEKLDKERERRRREAEEAAEALRREEEERRAAVARRAGPSAAKAASSAVAAAAAAAASSDAANGTPAGTAAAAAAATQAAFAAAKRQQTADDLKERLRYIGAPVTLFGESDEERARRLEALLAEHGDRGDDSFALGEGHEGKNPFLMRTLSERQAMRDKALNRAGGGSGSTGKAGGGGGRKEKAGGAGGDEDDDVDSEDDGGAGEEGAAGGGAAGVDGRRKRHRGILTDEEIASMDDHKLIRVYFKGLLRSWEEDLNDKPDDFKGSVAGRNEIKKQKQSKDYMRLLFKECKQKTLDPGIRTNVVKIIGHMRDGEFVRAHDVYLQAAIGNAAWPIGVAMVGIHDRTGREKIQSKNVAHIMNNEAQRKYFVSVRRLMTYEQDRRPDVPPSKKVR